jgi:hypothetical protein
VSRVVYTPIATYETRSASRVNTIFDDIETAGASLTAPNLAEEGLDITAWNANLPCPGRLEGETGTGINRTVLALSAGWTDLTLGAVQIRLGAITLVAGDILRVRARVGLESIVGSLGLSNATFGIAIAYTVAAVTLRVTNTERRHSLLSAATNNHETLRTFHRRDGPATITDVRVQYTHPHAAVGFAAAGVASITGVLFRRQS